MEIVIPTSFGEIKDYLPVTKGPEPKFNYDKRYLTEIEYSKLKEKYLKMVFLLLY